MNEKLGRILKGGFKMGRRPKKGKGIKPYPETHQQGLISIENVPPEPQSGVGLPYLKGDLGIQVATDGRVWICIDGIAFLRFNPNLISPGEAMKPRTDPKDPRCYLFPVNISLPKPMVDKMDLPWLRNLLLQHGYDEVEDIVKEAWKEKTGEWVKSDGTID